MAKPSEAIMAFKEKYGIDSDELWPVPGGKSYAIMHKALQRVARQQGIIITVNVVEALCNIEAGFAVVKAFGKLGDAFCESYGEASPKNNRNQYPLAMAQKRAEDRVILGLLSVYGDVYGEDEIDNSKQSDISDDETITRDDGIQILTVDAQRRVFEELKNEIPTNNTVEECKRWKRTALQRASRLSDHWRKILNDLYLDHLRGIERRDADEYIERITA